MDVTKWLKMGGLLGVLCVVVGHALQKTPSPLAQVIGGALVEIGDTLTVTGVSTHAVYDQQKRKQALAAAGLPVKV